MKNLRYAIAETPEEYKCSECGDTGVKLWRRYNTFADYIELLCLKCAEKDQGKKIDEYPSDCIWGLVPAVPCEDEDTYWGYTSVPQEGVRWWKALPPKLLHMEKN